MKVKIGDRWYDSEQVPICIQISPGEREHIAKLDFAVATEGKYASFPDNWGTVDEMRTWMRDG